ncbi:SDR family NAD(P)-dependent oxidoreductase [Duganella callida]|uniref:NADP-dependent 3-hydroxy acid dehydrogenase YdfG n=1 Tax=Duganella callida TaxID=2561932 RepID=A0A4Y9SL61_9BURK|nr:SDR family oxidoreductase [Duganella callida]TFW27181.1 SDR family oxidoreductase [Duganella callida]
MNTTPSSGVALITGASAGIGATYADRLARRGHDLILVARNRGKLDDLSHRLKVATGRQISVVTADLTQPDDLRKVEAIARQEARLNMLVNNAGVGSATPLVGSDVDSMEAMIDINVTALTRLSYAVAPEFLRRGGGTIINISSGVAVAPDFLNGVYGASKAYVLAFSQSLATELDGKNVRVQVVLPGVIRTEFWDDSGTSIDDIPGDMVMCVDDLVDAALAGLDQGEFATLPSLPDTADWDKFDAARHALRDKLSFRKPAARYLIG